METKLNRNNNFWPRKFPLLLSIPAFILFIFLSVKAAHLIPVAMDEGSYLIKGWWYLTGVYRPFQAYGPVANKMPLAYLVPGLSQLIEPGIRSGRYFSIFLGSLLLLGLWLTTNRLSNKWWAAIVVWAVVMNQNWLIYYARPFSQVTTALFITWSLFFLVGDDRKPLEPILGGLFSCFVLLTRQNMVSYFVFTLIFLGWRYGWKKGVLYSTPAIVLTLIVHIIYWPGIYMMIWRPAMPAFLREIIANSGLLADWVRSSGSRPGDHGFKLVDIIQEFFGGARFSLVPVLSAGWLALIYPYRQMASSPKNKNIFFILINFIVLTLVHILAVIKDNTILFSFPGYMAFFNPLGLLLIPSSYPYLLRKYNLLQTILGGLLILVLSTGIGMNLYREISGSLMKFMVPRMDSINTGKVSIELWRILVNKFGWDYFSQERILPALSGLAVGILIIALSIGLRLIFRKKPEISLGHILLISSLSITLILTPTFILGGSGDNGNCTDDSIRSFEKVGLELKKIIPPGSLVYWGIDKAPSPALLLYIPDVRTFPVQINLDYYHRTGIDVETALHNNYWTDETARLWRDQADFILLDDSNTADLAAELSSNPGKFDQLQPTSLSSACQPKSFLHIYKVIQ